MYPRLEINISKLKYNVYRLKTILEKHNLKMAIVTKAYCAMPEVVSSISKEYVDYIADSRIENLSKLVDINIPKILLRIPMISEVDDVIKYSDISFNSEIKTIIKLNEKANEKNIKHKVVLMVDLGDLREGFFYEENLFDTIEKVLKLENIELIGIGTNLTCYGAILPSKENLGKLVSISKKIEEKFNLKLEFVSGGNSSSIDILQKGDLPKGITNLRLGEAILLGRESAYEKYIEDTYHDSFKLFCEIVEIKEKPSLPIGEVGVDAFGNKPVYKDKGIMKRAILAIGKQDVDISALVVQNDKIEIVGASSDHMILDITHANTNFQVGDEIEFIVSKYAGILTLSTSSYVKKQVVLDENLEVLNT